MFASTCADCERIMIPQRTWNAADRGDRNQWLREGKRKGQGHKLCSACYQVKRRATLPKPTRTCATCDEPPTSTRHDYCDDCRERREREQSAARSARRREAARLAEQERGGSHRESPATLTDGRWVTGRGPSGLPIKVWEAA